MPRQRRLFYAGCCLLLLGQVWIAQAQVTLNLKDADIQTLVASVAEITGRNFVLDPRVRGKVSLISSRPLAEDEIYDVFLSVLATYGFAAIPGDNVTKIVPTAGAKQQPVPTIEPRAGQPGDDQIVTQVIDVNNASAAQLVPILRPLLPPEAHLAAEPSTNTLIVSDSYSNVTRIVDLVRRIDRADDTDVSVLQLRYAAANDVVQTLESLEQSRQENDAAAAMNPVRLVADERSNSVLISGPGAGRERLQALAAALDTPLQARGNTQVIYLRYADATALVGVLQGVSSRLEANAEAAGDDAAASPVARLADGGIDIQADETTNALIITAEPDELRTLQNVIAQLDIRRAQVLVEAVIAEVSSDKVAELGVQWVADGSDDGSIVGFTNFDSASFNGLSLSELGGAILNESLPSTAPLGAAIALGDFGGSVQFGALVSALASDADTNVLATPTLVTLDNEEAEIVVGQNVPFVTGTFTTDVTDGGVNNPFQTIERRDVGLTLRVKPQINEGDAVQLDITQELSNVVQTATALAQGPTTSKRSIKTNVLLEDGQVLVLGGLIQDDLSETLQKVPWLGDIPLLGNLFRYRQTSKSKTNLMVFLHPVILRDALDSSASSGEKYSYIREQQLNVRQRGVGLLPEVDTPLLKPSDRVRQDRSLLPAPRRPVIDESQRRSAAELALPDSAKTDRRNGGFQRR